VLDFFGFVTRLLSNLANLLILRLSKYYHTKSWASIRQLSFLVLVFFSWHVASSQQMSGLAMSDYAGINAASLNPSLLVNSEIYFDLNLLAGDIFLQNNFLFVHKADFRFMDLLKRNPTFPSYDVEGEGLDYKKSLDFINAFEQTDIRGPSFSIVLDKQAFGFSTRMVTMTSAKNLPGYLGELMFEGLEYVPLHGIPQDNGQFDAVSAGWWEMGLSYAREIKQQRWYKWSFGVNLRRLWGYAGAGIVNQNAKYTVINDSVINIENLDASLGFSIPVDYDTGDFPDGGATFNGKGTVIDLGVSYLRKRNVSTNRTYKSFCQYEYDDYLYKIGASITDLGSLVFKENAKNELFEDASKEWNGIDTLEFVSVNDIFQQLSTAFYDDPEASDQGGNFVLGLPATLSLHADYQYYPNWHLAGLVVLPLRIWDKQLRRPAQALISLRYATPAWEVALPVSLYNFKEPRIGLSARYYFLTIGTDKIGGFLGMNDFTGMDFYFSLKFHILKGSCGRFKRSSDCSNFNF